MAEKTRLKWAELKPLLASLASDDLLELLGSLHEQSLENQNLIYSRLLAIRTQFPMTADGGLVRSEASGSKEMQSLQQLAKEFGYNPEHLRQMAVKGRLKGQMIGHTWVSTRSDIEDYLRARKRAGRPTKRSSKKRPSTA